MAEQIQRGPMPAMGSTGITDSLINMSGQRSPNTRLGDGAGGPGKSTSPDGPPAGRRRAVLLDPEASGPIEVPVPTPGGPFYQWNAPAGAQHQVTCHRVVEPPQERGSMDVLIAADHDKRSPMWSKRLGWGR